MLCLYTSRIWYLTLAIHTLTYTSTIHTPSHKGYIHTPYIHSLYTYTLIQEPINISVVLLSEAEALILYPTMTETLESYLTTYHHHYYDTTRFSDLMIPKYSTIYEGLIVDKCDTTSPLFINIHQIKFPNLG